MRTTSILAFICLFNVTGSIYSQNTKLNIDVRETTIREVFKLIERQSEFRFFFNDDFADLNRKVNFDAKNEKVEDILYALLEQSDVSYKVLDNNLIVIAPAVELKQSSTISGTVTDNGEPMPGVNVVVKGTLNGVVTDVNGKYSINVPDQNAILVFSFVGYVTREFPAGNQTRADIVMIEDTRQIEEVVVVAYGTQKIRHVTGAMSRLSTDELADMPVSNMGQKMQGKFSGVQIYQSTGEPNGGLSFRVRGQASVNGGNNPLVVIDGFPSSTGLESLSPDEIETITVLKDAASSALYGSRAANGVIMVTTKGAKEGKTNIEFSAYYGWEKVSNKGKPDVMNAHEFARFKKEIYEDQMIYEGRTEPVPTVYQNPDQVGEGTDWYDVLLRTANTQNYNLSLSTGTSRFKSAVNVNYNKQEGVILNTYSERFSARANNLFEASDRISFGFNVAGSYLKSQITPDLGGGRQIIGSAFLMDPQLKYINDDGTYPVSYAQPGMFANPNYYRVLTERQNPSKRINALVNAFMDIEIIKGLKYRLSANVNLGNKVTQQFIPSTANGAMFSAPPKPATGFYDTQNNMNWLIENTLNYSKTLAEKHHFDALIGYTTQKATNEHSRIDASNYPDDAVSWFNAASTKVGTSNQDDKSGADQWWDWSMISYLGRLNYNYDGKYLLSATFRRDGCSRFGPNAKWANFPSISLGWIISDEGFMKEVNHLSYLKLRASYGKVGNNNIGNYSYMASAVTTNYVFNGGIAPGRGLDRIENPDLTWETTKQYDLGLDFGFFNDRIFFVYDFYHKTTNGLLYQIDIPRQSGFESIQSNIGEFKFWGHEFGVETKNFVGVFKWNTNLNITFNRNKAIKLGTNDTPIGGNYNQEDYNRTEVGKPLGQFYGYIYDGIFMTQAEYEAGPKHASSKVGTVRMKDLNSDGVIDMSDRTFIGNPNPDFLYGITNEFYYKNFDASIVMAGAVGGDIIDGTLEWTENIDGVFNVRKEVAERWRSEENPGNGNIPRTQTGTTELFRFNNTRWVSNGSYLAIKNLTIGYTLPVKSNPYIRSVRFYGSAQNLLTITKYHGMNPEVNANGSDGLRQGRDLSSYPVARVYTIGMNIKF